MKPLCVIKLFGCSDRRWAEALCKQLGVVVEFVGMDGKPAGRPLTVGLLEESAVVFDLGDVDLAKDAEY